jgi:3-methylcrotonyl-CoA carboxylase alpha subunit
MPGKVLEVLVKTGEEVQSGTPLMVLEAMKMEHRIVAAKDGVVTAVHFEAGDQVTQGAVLLELDE